MNINLVSKRRIHLPFVGRYLHAYVVILMAGILGFLIPFLAGVINGFPDGHVQDELSNVLAADTYTNFRITNPTPAHHESFEAPHVIVEPSYISKYAPAQAAFMAVGKLLLGHYIFGVWIACGLTAASLLWMLLAWTRPTWAIAGTILMIFTIGINSYWAQSYWGGMLAAAGGSLFFGGFRRLFNRLSVGSTIWMTIGGIMLVNSRPFEGTVTMLIPLAVLAIWLIRNQKDEAYQKLLQVILPALVVSCFGFSLMGYQYYRVTGSPIKLPYSTHHAQYSPTPLFSFQQITPSADRGNDRLRRIYETYTSPPILEFVPLPGREEYPSIDQLYGFVYLLIALPLFLLSPFFLALVYLCLPGMIMRNKWLVLMLGTVLFTFLMMSMGKWWDQYHYSAPLTAVVFLFAAEGIRYFYISAHKGREKRFIAFTLVALALSSIIFQQILSYPQYYMQEDFTSNREQIISSLTTGENVQIKVPTRATFFKAEFERIVDKLPGNYVAIVSYDTEYDIHDEIVFNRSNIEASKMLWAHDLGKEKNSRMLEYYSNRKVVLIRLEGSSITIKPLGTNESPTWKTKDLVAAACPLL